MKIPPFKGSKEIIRKIFTALENGKNCLLTGEAGSGKTRIFFEVAHMARRRGRQIVVVEHHNSLTRLEQEIADCFGFQDVLSMRRLRNRIYREAAERSFWLLVDNFLGENRAVNHFLHTMTRLSCRVAVNFRKDELQSTRQAFQALERTEVFRLEPLSVHCARDLIEWCRLRYGLERDIPQQRLLRMSRKLPGLIVGICSLLRKAQYTSAQGYMIGAAEIDFRTALHLNRGRWGLFDERSILESLRDRQSGSTSEGLLR